MGIALKLGRTNGSVNRREGWLVTRVVPDRLEKCHGEKAP